VRGDCVVDISGIVDHHCVTITSHLQRAYTVMVSNCTNINKKNNRLSPEHTENRKDHDNEVGNVGSGCDCLQFHQYQQNCHHEKTTTYDAGYPGPDVAKIHTDALMLLFLIFFKSTLFS
jgi:hypothetical protein